MIRFNKLDTNEMATIAKKIIATVILAGISVGLGGVAGVISSCSDQLIETNHHLEELLSAKQISMNNLADISKSLVDIKVDQTDSVWNGEELVVTLGDCARETGVSIVGLCDSDAIVDGAITKYNFKFEIKGTMQQIAETLSNVDARELHYSINEMSLRQEADYIWLQRNFDEQITWWDLSNITTAGGFQTKVNITTDDIISDSTMTLYLDVDFIFVTSELEPLNDEVASMSETVASEPVSDIIHLEG